MRKLRGAKKLVDGMSYPQWKAMCEDYQTRWRSYLSNHPEIFDHRKYPIVEHVDGVTNYFYGPYGVTGQPLWRWDLSRKEKKERKKQPVLPGLEPEAS